MIVRAHQGALHLYLQTDHALLAGEFARQWGNDQFKRVEPLAAVKLAADLHDEGWAQWEQEPQISPETGRPYDFPTIPQDQHVAIYRRCVQMALAQHPYAGLLVSLHGTGLYRQRYGHMPHLPHRAVAPACENEVRAFLDEHQLLQDQLMAELRVEETTVWTHYRWLQAWDTMSVFICKSDPGGRDSMQLGLMPVAPGGEEQMLAIRGIGEGTYTVSPWPFAAKRMEWEIPLRVVPDRRYDSAEDFREQFYAAPTRRQTVVLLK